MFLRKKLAAARTWVYACLGLALLSAAFGIGCGGGGTAPPPTQTEQMTGYNVITLIVQ
jgi:hypothetical protein